VNNEEEQNKKKKTFMKENVKNDAKEPDKIESKIGLFKSYIPGITP
jgi:hypothetical protein